MGNTSHSPRLPFVTTWQRNTQSFGPKSLDQKRKNHKTRLVTESKSTNKTNAWENGALLPKCTCKAIRVGSGHTSRSTWTISTGMVAPWNKKGPDYRTQRGWGVSKREKGVLERRPARKSTQWWSNRVLVRVRLSHMWSRFNHIRIVFQTLILCLGWIVVSVFTRKLEKLLKMLKLCLGSSPCWASLGDLTPLAWLNTCVTTYN